MVSFQNFHIISIEKRLSMVKKRSDIKPKQAKFMEFQDDYDS